MTSALILWFLLLDWKDEMEPASNTGIVFERINLLELTYKTNPAFKGALVLPEILPSYHYQISMDEKRQRKVLQCVLSCEFLSNKSETPFTFSLTMLAIFHSELEIPYPLEEFAKLQAPAYMMPYVRELVSSITARTIYPTLNLPPINLISLLGKQIGSQKGGAIASMKSPPRRHKKKKDER